MLIYIKLSFLTQWTKMIGGINMTKPMELLRITGQYVLPVDGIRKSRALLWIFIKILQDSGLE
jgi:hypothetical protein